MILSKKFRTMNALSALSNSSLSVKRTSAIASSAASAMRLSKRSLMLRDACKQNARCPQQEH
eukprot:13645981-Alexandrium_andersonii.AAC.1